MCCFKIFILITQNVLFCFITSIHFPSSVVPCVYGISFMELKMNAKESIVIKVECLLKKCTLWLYEMHTLNYTYIN